MYKKFIALILIFLTVFIPVTGLANSKNNNTLIVYDTNRGIGETVDGVFVLEKLLANFSSSIITKHESDIKQNELSHYSNVVVISNSGTFYNKEFIKQLVTAKNKIIVIGNELEWLNSIKLVPANIMQKEYDYTEIIYDEDGVTKKILRKSYLGVSKIELLKKDIKVLASFKNGHKTNPMIFNYQNKWVISGVEYFGGSYYVISDKLSDILERNKTFDNTIFVRIEDVHPLRDQEKLKEVADYLQSQNVPFLIALIPAFHNSNGDIVTLNEVSGFSETIKYMTDRGGSIVLHGYTHAGYGEVSGEGYEYWDGVNNRPITDRDEKEYIENSIYEALKICIKSEIYPLAFEPPHYAISMNGFKQVANYFSVFCGQIQPSNETFVTVELPFSISIRNDDPNTGSKYILSENLGYVSENNGNSVRNIINKYNQQKDIKGYSGGFFFHPNMNITELKSLISFFKKQSVNFVNLKTLNSTVKIRDIFIKSNNGKIVASILNSNENIEFKKITMAIIIIMTILLFLLLIVFLRFRKYKIIRYKSGEPYEF